MTSNKVASFWHGPSLSSLEVACLMTFVARGFDVTVYSYAPLEGLPSALRSADAGAIVHPQFLNSFKVGGKPSLSHFSDLFRYKLFQETGEVWIDSDLVCLKPFDINPDESLFAKEVKDGINGAIMRIDPNDQRLKLIIDRCLEYANGVDFKWGATGPTLVTDIFGEEALAQAHPVERFYPIHWLDWWRPFLPSYRDWCAEHCRAADALHLWNNIVERSGYWKDLAPPIGSYLYDAFKEDDSLSLFKEVCPESVMMRLMESDVNLQSGRHFKLTELARLTVGRTRQRILEKAGIERS